MIMSPTCVSLHTLAHEGTHAPLHTARGELGSFHSQQRRLRQVQGVPSS